MNMVQEIWHSQNNTPHELLTAALNISMFTNTKECQAIAYFFSKRTVPTRHKPVLVGGTKTVYSVFHQGGHYTVYVLGEPTSILQYCSLSENEREKSLLESRRMQNTSATVVSVATGILDDIPKNLRSINHLTFCGHISIV